MGLTHKALLPIGPVLEWRALDLPSFLEVLVDCFLELSNGLPTDDEVALFLPVSHRTSLSQSQNVFAKSVTGLLGVLETLANTGSSGFLSFVNFPGVTEEFFEVCNQGLEAFSNGGHAHYCTSA
jgi:hypothetical protein